MYIKTGEEAKEPPISTTESYVGNYADIDGDGTVDGIIYADLAVGGSGQWGTNGWGNYTIPKVSSGLKEYYVSQTDYAGAFGTKDVISPQGSGTDRFYVMALDDIDSSTHYWYYNASGKLDNYIDSSVNDFGEGKTNTEAMISKWNSSAYGAQNSKDMWGLIQTQAKKGWFVPSKSEWAAFGGNLGITNSNYLSYGLKSLYWSATSYTMIQAYAVDYYYTALSNYNVNTQVRHCPFKYNFLIL